MNEKLCHSPCPQVILEQVWEMDKKVSDNGTVKAKFFEMMEVQEEGKISERQRGSRMASRR